MDHLPRYTPSVVCLAAWGNLEVKRVVIHPPENKLHGFQRAYNNAELNQSSDLLRRKDKKNCIRSDLFAVELVTDKGSRWFGFERAYINSELRVVVQGFSEKDEVRSKWEIVPPNCRY